MSIYAQLNQRDILCKNLEVLQIVFFNQIYINFILLCGCVVLLQLRYLKHYTSM